MGCRSITRIEGGVEVGFGLGGLDMLIDALDASNEAVGRLCGFCLSLQARAGLLFGTQGVPLR